MKKSMVIMLVGMLFVSYGLVHAAEPTGPMEKFAAQQIDQLEMGCKVELDTYCKDVTPGEGRQLSCVYAYKDKLSSQCEKALYNSAQEFAVAAEMLNAFAAACKADIEKLCSQVAIGEGRIMKCLEENKEKLAPGCNEARVQAK
jgi:hypothetical protein